MVTINIKIMGLFGFIGNAASAAIKTATAPIAVVKDIADAALGGDPESTENIIKSIAEDIEDAFDSLTGEDF